MNFLKKLSALQELSIPIYYMAMIAIALLFIQDSGDDDDEGGGLMQPVYQGSNG